SAPARIGEGVLPSLGCVASYIFRETAAEAVDAVGPGGVSHARAAGVHVDGVVRDRACQDAAAVREDIAPGSHVDLPAKHNLVSHGGPLVRLHKLQDDNADEDGDSHHCHDTVNNPGTGKDLVFRFVRLLHWSG